MTSLKCFKIPYKYLPTFYDILEFRKIISYQYYVAHVKVSVCFYPF